MKKKIKFSLDQNPLKWHKQERFNSTVVPDVERLKFNQVYDYALWLEEQLKLSKEKKD